MQSINNAYIQFTYQMTQLWALTIILPEFKNIQERIFENKKEIDMFFNKLKYVIENILHSPNGINQQAEKKTFQLFYRVRKSANLLYTKILQHLANVPPVTSPVIKYNQLK